MTVECPSVNSYLFFAELLAEYPHKGCVFVTTPTSSDIYVHHSIPIPAMDVKISYFAEEGSRPLALDLPVSSGCPYPSRPPGFGHSPDGYGFSWVAKKDINPISWRGEAGEGDALGRWFGECPFIHQPVAVFVYLAVADLNGVRAGGADRGVQTVALVDVVETAVRV